MLLANPRLTNKFIGGAVTTPITFADGTYSAPSITFTSDTALGFYYKGASTVGFTKILSIGDGTNTTSANSINFGEVTTNLYRIASYNIQTDGLLSATYFSPRGEFRGGDGGASYYEFGRDNQTTGNWVITYAGGNNPLVSLTTGGLWTIGNTTTNTGSFGLYAADNAAPAAFIRINATQANLTAADVFMNFNSTSGTEGSIAGTAVAGVIAFNTFTGSHWAQSNSIDAIALPSVTIKKEHIEDKEHTVDGKTVIKHEVVITEEELTAFTSDIEPGAVLISTGELSQWDDELCNTLPKVALSTKKEDKAVYGVYGGHDRDGDIQVLALGTGIILVCDEGGVIDVGDFLCSSSTPGYAMRYDGMDMRVVVAKARHSWERGKGKIACTLLAG